MSRVITLRLPEHTAERLQARARRAGRSVSEVGARSIEEWLRQDEFAEIEFRTINGERHACLKRAQPVWQIVMVARELEMDAARIADYFQAPESRIRAALHYYSAFVEEIDSVLAENDAVTFDSLKRMLPSIEMLQVHIGPESDRPKA